MFHPALILAGVVVGAAAAGALAPQAGDGDPIAWRSDLRRAEAEAAESRRPLLLVFR